MNLKDEKYAKHALCKEMLETSKVVKTFDTTSAKEFAEKAKAKKSILFTGEGSSRLFPAKRAMYAALQKGITTALYTEGATQALEYSLSDAAVFGASNSGKTKELIRLFDILKKDGHSALFGLTANSDTPLEKLSDKTHVLGCGKEDAVAATKSVVEQALFYDALIRSIAGESMSGLDEAADKINAALTMNIDGELTQTIKNADMIYFAGRNNGVCEELTLKANEITRKKSDYLEGTYAVHGIEEVMDKDEVVIIIDPFKDEEEKFKEVLCDGIGMKVIAVAGRDTIFPTIKIPNEGECKEYIELAAGWNILVETGIALGIDLDKPVRARKVGNEYIAQ